MDETLASGLIELAMNTPVAKGAKGHDVRRIQEWLTLNGCGTGIDGDYGPGTAMAVRRFQEKCGLTVSGVVDTPTWSKLVEPLARVLVPLPFAPSTSLATAVSAVAHQHLAVHPVEAGGDNMGPWVRLYMRGKQGKAQLWCAGFVSFVIAQAAAWLKQDLPFAGTFSCDQLATFAKQTGRFVPDSAMSDIGNFGIGIFLVRASKTDWVHTGFVISGGDQAFKSIEGNTNDDGNRNGFEVCMRSRSVFSKDFIRLS
ncbi:peptidoglycan-binding protein [Chitinivorax sp. B]|uniref:peptidoglycan-binding domain-containing protein n=1 Tax=Chitinivorax sp. B TaxID=2502235 RepID=UPI0010F54965|nr:peptidoglycan-binding protein [Chitinivorax sp. B]